MKSDLLFGPAAALGGPGSADSRMRLREALVYGPMPSPSWPAQGLPGLRSGDALRQLGVAERRQVLLVDLLGGLRIEGHAGTAQVRLGRAQLAISRAPIDLQAELGRCEVMADLRRERAAEIAAQAEDGCEAFANVLALSPERTPATLALLEVAWLFAGCVAQRVKAIVHAPRPGLLSPRIQPMLPTPASGSHPGGLATQASLAAGLLYLVITQPGSGSHPWAATLRPMLEQLAARMAENREIAGLNFAADATAGKLLGDRLLAGLLEAKSQPVDARHPQDGHALAWLWRQAAAEWGG